MSWSLANAVPAIRPAESDSAADKTAMLIGDRISKFPPLVVVYSSAYVAPLLGAAGTNTYNPAPHNASKSLRKTASFCEVP